MRSRPFLRQSVRSFAVAVAIIATLVQVSPALASEQHPTLADLEGEVMCPTCHTTLDQAPDAPVTRRIEHFISARIGAGDTKSEIKARLVAQFGSAILAAPPKH